MNVSMKRMFNIYIYILIALLSALFTNKAYAANHYTAYCYANGGHWSDGRTVHTDIYDIGDGDDIAYLRSDSPIRDGYTFCGYIEQYSDFINDSDECAGAIYNWMNGVESTITYSVYRSTTNSSGTTYYRYDVSVDTKAGNVTITGYYEVGSGSNRHYTKDYGYGNSQCQKKFNLSTMWEKRLWPGQSFTGNVYAIWAKSPHTHNSSGVEYSQNNASLHNKYTYCNGHGSDHSQNRKSSTENHSFGAWSAWTDYSVSHQRQQHTCSKCGYVAYNYRARPYTITYDANEGILSKTSYTIDYGSSLGTMPTGTRTGYTLAGYYTSPTGGTKVSSSTAVTGNATYYAHWTPITYTITYKLNGGKMDYKKAKYNIETPTFYIENPTKKGYNFTGWTGTGIDTADTDLSVTLGSYGNKTFEATWGKGVYTISFDGNGATSGEMDTITVESDESIKLPENSFVREGYSFVGWYTTKEDRFGTFYRNGATVSNLEESVTLHAQWKKEKETVVPGENGNNGTGNAGDNGSTGDNGNGGNGSGSGNNSGNSGTGDGNGGSNGSGDNGSGSGNGGSAGDNGNGGNSSGSGNGSGNSGSGEGNGDNNGSGSNGSGTGNGGSTGDNGNGGNGSGSGRGGNNGKNVPVVTPKDEIGYFGTAQRRNEISIRTTLGMNDNKLTLNYNY